MRTSIISSTLASSLGSSLEGSAYNQKDNVRNLTCIFMKSQKEKRKKKALAGETKRT